MANKAYAKGYRFEREVFKLFSSSGFYVIRSSGSHGVFDLLAVKDGIAYGIQAKYNNHISAIEKQAMINCYETYGIIPLYVYRMKGKPIQIICLLNNKVIKPEELTRINEVCGNAHVKKLIKLNGGRKDE